MKCGRFIQTKKYFLPIILFFTLVSNVQLSGQDMTLSDDAISDHIQEEFYLSQEIDANEINISTTDGIVTLNGEADDLLEKRQSEKIAMSVRGVETIINDIDVRPSVKNDAVLETEIEDALLANPATDSYNIKVEVDDGKATLKGQVTSYHEKMLAENIASAVEGLTSVENSLNIEYTGIERTDYELKTEIEKALKYNVRLYRQPIDIEVIDGSVWLKGEVSSLIQKNLAIAEAWTAGVERVYSADLDINPDLMLRAWKEDLTPEASDREIKEAITMALIRDPKVSTDEISVSVNNGNVILKGTVESLQAKNTAANRARHVVGVDQIRNYIKIYPIVEPADTYIIENVEKALTRSPLTDPYNLKVSANEGVVTLEGTVESQLAKERASTLAAGTKGVAIVMNRINVVDDSDAEYVFPTTWNYMFPSPTLVPASYYDIPLTDKQLKENVKNQFWWSPYVDTKSVDISVENGEVILSGQVGTWVAKINAIKNAYEAGADDVNDQMVIRNQIDYQ